MFSLLVQCNLAPRQKLIALYCYVQYLNYYNVYIIFCASTLYHCEVLPFYQCVKNANKTTDLKKNQIMFSACELPSLL